MLNVIDVIKKKKTKQKERKNEKIRESTPRTQNATTPFGILQPSCTRKINYSRLDILKRRGVFFALFLFLFLAGLRFLNSRIYSSVYTRAFLYHVCIWHSVATYMYMYVLCTFYKASEKRLRVYEQGPGSLDWPKDWFAEVCGLYNSTAIDCR